MSSSIDYFECPKCGENASKEQDNRTCEIICSCSVCNWRGEVGAELKEIRENLEIWLKENENNETLFELYKQHLKDKREIEPKYFISFERFLKKYYFKVVNK